MFELQIYYVNVKIIIYKIYKNSYVVIDHSHNYADYTCIFHHTLCFKQLSKRKKNNPMPFSLFFFNDETKNKEKEPSNKTPISTLAKC